MTSLKQLWKKQPSDSKIVSEVKAESSLIETVVEKTIENKVGGSMPGWSFLVGPIVSLFDKAISFIPNKNDRAKAKETFELELATTLGEVMKGQIEINKIEAGHKSKFVAGWRPFIGWICGFGIMWAFLLQPILVWTLPLAGIDTSTMPKGEIDSLMELVIAMLGMGTLRTFEKIKGVSAEKL